MIVSSALQAPIGVSVGLFFGSQVLAVVDILLYILGRYHPRATMAAIHAEEWLGQLPWKRHD